MNDVVNNEIYRATTPVEKIVTSLINVSLVFIFLIPFIIAGVDVFELKLIATGLFFIENLISQIFNDYRHPRDDFAENILAKAILKSPSVNSFCVIYRQFFYNIVLDMDPGRFAGYEPVIAAASMRDGHKDDTS